ncbi:prolipoprotein diacylglyceryl transferase [Kineococcus sp. SYSU DK001]|uniref:prolipoprotein diacylglyceryl transferase n=1 Tax=Kineococcus sp. SYSU DK001 TaxID=3383122 RepID=UPI003D7D801B
MITSLPAVLPSPTVAVWHLGPLPVRAYALCIVAGIVLGVLIAERRWRARGGRPDFVLDVAVWAVPLGVVGARVYHVITSPQAYFGAGGDPVRALYVWEGGLGIWGAIAGGAVGAWIACRRAGYRFLPLADAMAPGLLVAQALGRWGNWFNNELFGRATDVPWALTIHDWDEAAGRAVLDADGDPVVTGTYHPTFLYESLWCLLVALVIVLADRRWQLRHGQSFFAYVALYCLGRSVFEALRIDEANLVLGLRVNQWVAAIVFVAALIAFIRSRRVNAGRDEVLERVHSSESPTATTPDGDPGSPSGGQTVTAAGDRPSPDRDERPGAQDS